MFEEAGTTIEQAEKLCRHAMPMVIGSEDNVWCGKTSLICYKCLGERCDSEEFEVQPIV